MIEAEREKFAELVSGVYAYYRAEPSEMVLDVWWNALHGYDLSALREAFGRHCVNPDSGQFLPKIADVVRMLGGSTQDAALIAWTKFDQAVRSFGAYYTVVFDDPLIHCVVDEMGGWMQFCTSGTDENWPFRQNEFVARYRGYRGRSMMPKYAGKLLGIFDAENGAAGFKVENEYVRLIGDEKRALKVLADELPQLVHGLRQVGKLVALPEKK